MFITTHNKSTPQSPSQHNNNHQSTHTLPKTVWAPSSHAVSAVVMKNCVRQNTVDEIEAVVAPYSTHCTHLRTVRVGAGVGHGEKAGSSVLTQREANINRRYGDEYARTSQCAGYTSHLEIKVLIRKLLAVDGLTTSAVAASEVTCTKYPNTQHLAYRRLTHAQHAPPWHMNPGMIRWKPLPLK